MAENPFDKWVTSTDAPVEVPPPASATGEPVNPFSRFATESPPQGDRIDPVTGKLRIRVTPNNAPPPPQEDIGRGTAMGLGAVQGLTFNTGDELAGLMAAGSTGLPEGAEKVLNSVGPLGVLMRPGLGAGRMIGEQLTGQNDPTLTSGITGEQPQGPATAAGETERNRVRKMISTSQQQYPYSYGTAQVGGSMAIPAGTIMRGVTMGAKMLRGLLTGTGFGALAGAGEGEDLADRATKAGTGAVIGGAVGAATPPVAAGLGVVAGTVAAPFKQAWRSLREPELEAARRGADVTAAAQTRLAANPTTEVFDRNRAALTPAEYAAAEARGQPVAAIDMAGRPGRALARSARNTAGADQGAESLETAVGSRAGSATERAGDFIDRLTVGRMSLQQIQERAANANRPAYERAQAAANALVSRNKDALWTPELQRLSGAPDIQEVMLGVGRKEGNRSILEGAQSPRQNPFVPRNETYRVGVRGRGDPAAASESKPDLNVWDSVQRVLRGKAGEAERGGNLERARELNRLRSRVINELDRIVPEFRDARGTAFRGFRAEDAYEAGENYVKLQASGRDRDALQATIANMSLSDRALFMHGFATKLISHVREAGYGNDVVRRIFSSPAARARIGEALGPNRTRELEAYLHVERIMNDARAAVTGNSSTVMQAASYGVAGNLAYSGLTGSNPFDFGSILSGVGAAGGRRVAGRATSRLADHVGEMLASPDADVFRRGIALLAHDNRLMERIRNFGTKVGTRALPPQTVDVLGPNAISRARSEGEPVPGPVQQ